MPKENTMNNLITALEAFLQTLSDLQKLPSVIVLIGESASGKSSVEKELVNLGFNHVVSYTTRPPRKGEIDGVDYHFISETQFNDMMHNDEFCENSTYRGWRYGSAKADYKGKTVIVANPHGLRQISKQFELDVYSVYINIPRNERLIKLLERGDNVDEACRRSLSDEGQFTGIKDEVNLILDNQGYKLTPKDLALRIIGGFNDRNKDDWSNML